MLCDPLAQTCQPIAPGPITDPFDPSKIALIGHSAGAQVAPMTFAIQPRYGLGFLGGHNGSYISNVLYKVDPQPGAGLLGGHDIFTVRDMAELGATLRTHVDGEGSAAINIVQQLLEAGDTPVCNANLTAPRLIRHGTTAPTQYLLSIQGVIDHYIEPPIGKAADFTAGLSLAVQTPASTLPFGALDTMATYNDTTAPHGPRDDAGTLYPLGVDAHGFRPMTSDLDPAASTLPSPARWAAGSGASRCRWSRRRLSPNIPPTASRMATR